MQIIKSYVRNWLAERNRVLVKLDAYRRRQRPPTSPKPKKCETRFDSVNAARFRFFSDLVTRTRDIPGDIVECGVGVGRSILFMALSVKIDLVRAACGFDSRPDGRKFGLRERLRRVYLIAPGRSPNWRYRNYERHSRSRIYRWRNTGSVVIVKHPAVTESAPSQSST